MVRKIIYFIIFKHEYKTIHSGEVDNDINFTYETNTAVYGSCAASLNDEMWILGGSSQKEEVKRQVNF